MQGAGHRDSAWAAAVLDGTVATKGAWRDSGRQQHQRTSGQRSRSAGNDRGGASAGGGKKARRPSQHQHQQHRRQQDASVNPWHQYAQEPQQQHLRQQRNGAGAASASVGSASPKSSGGDSSATYSQPGPRSTARVAHCEACDVWVPRRAGDWEVHTAGIRHRRQLLSLRVHGERNRLVLSSFESAPDSVEAAQRLVGKAAADFGLVPPPGRSGGGGAGMQQAVPELLQAARRLRTEALKQLLSMFGVGQMYNAAAAAFEERQLAAGLHQAAHLLNAQRARQQHNEAQQQQAPPPPPQQQQQQGQQAALANVAAAADGAGTLHLEVSGGSASVRASTGAELAAAAHLVLAGRLNVAELSITLAQQPADAPRSQYASLAAALLLLPPALQRSSSLVSQRLTLPPTGGADAARLQQLWQRAWQHTLPALRGLLESSVPLRTLQMALPRCLQEATDAYMPQLEAAAAAAPVAVRVQVLLGLHPRVGRCSLLQLLPLAVVQEVLDLAAPLQPCAVHLEWVD